MVGFDNTIGYYMSLSRAFVFFPFFTYGYYLGHNVFQVYAGINNMKINKQKISIVGKIVCILCIFVICRIMYTQNLNGAALYGSVSYEYGESQWFVRLEMLAVAFVWIMVFMTMIPNRKLFIQIDTFPIYVLHGFIVLYLRKSNLFTHSLPINLLIAAIIDVAIILLFGNKYVSRVVRFIFRGDWIERIRIKR